MPKTMNNKGLCLSCRSNSNCAYRNNHQEPVLQCEEFDGYASVPMSAKIKKTAVAVDEPGSGKYKGLCANCEIRKTCKYPKPEDGVWHCEEYK